MPIIESFEGFQFNVTGWTFVAFGLFTFDWLVALGAHEGGALHMTAGGGECYPK